MIIKTYINNLNQLINNIDKKITGNDLKIWNIVKNDKNEILYSHTTD